MKNKETFFKLVNLKEKNLISKFNFGHFNSGKLKDNIINGKVIHNCGTSGCLAGNLPQFSDEWYFDEHGYLNYSGSEYRTTTEQISKYFDVPYEVCKVMFSPGVSYSIHNGLIETYYNDDLVSPSDATLKEVQKHIKFIMKKCPLYFED